MRYSGRIASFVMFRHLGGAGRHLWPVNARGFAHIVIAPDLTAAYRKQEEEPFPISDFGGVFLGDEVVKSELSSKHSFPNDDAHIKRMASRENLLVAHFDRKEDTRGFHTKHGENPWVMLEMKESSRISGLVIDAFNCHNRNMCVWVSNDGKNETLVYQADETRRRYRIDLQGKNVSGKFIRIGRAPGTPRDWFYLDKVVIYGKEK